ncbi:MAG TPA: single-stranded DNA-binding protein [Burkholderiaceae bacterium]|nr:single-stranded DNA-binding protein [Burkholderiaceae bacterium]
MPRSNAASAVTGNTVADHLVQAARELSQRLSMMTFSPPVTHVYNPLTYAWAPHELYLRRFATGPRRVVLLGMNPGPFGMMQTGVPFGEVAAVRGWMGIEAPVGRPAHEHPKRPVDGFACRRSEVSGRRLWGWAAERFGSAEAFFRDHFVLNYCPLGFMEASGRNFTPDKLPAAERRALHDACDAHLKRALELLQPSFAIGVGGFAQARLATVLGEGSGVVIGQILHPSPASPLANRGWSDQVQRQLEQMGVYR